jgi:PadR family transcriptional regulator, regulatory protein AphA
MHAKLTTTSYCVLGFLAMRSWSAYELATEIKKSLAISWPRAESRIYAEPKSLVEHGLASAEEEPGLNGRARTRYSITAAGRDALQSWLDDVPARPPSFENEAAIKVALAEFGERSSLVRTLERLEDQCVEMRLAAVAQCPVYAQNTGITTARVRALALETRLWLALNATVIQWARDARREVEAWPDPMPDDQAEEAYADYLHMIATLGPAPVARRAHRPRPDDRSRA